MALATWYARSMGVIFLDVAAVMLYHPQANLMQDGVAFDSFTVAGKAEVRAYYVGTALAVAYACISLETRLALRMVAIVLGGFASTRVVGYSLDGVDADDSFRMHQHGVFCAEVFGSLLAVCFLASLGAAKASRD